MLYQLDLDEPRVRPRNGGLETSESSELSGPGSVSVVGTPPKTIDVDVVYQGPYAARRGAALEEFGNAASMMPAPFVSVSTYSGYYVVNSVERDASIALEDGRSDTDKVNLGLTHAGTRASQHRAVRTGVSQPDPGNVFGNDTTAFVGVPADATRVEWIDGVPLANREDPVIVDTVQAEGGVVDLVDARASTFDSPILIYQPAEYEAIGAVDAGMWDTYGATEKTDDDGVVQWARVFSPEHDPRGAIVVENGLLELTLDPATGLAAREWDDVAGAWSAVALGASSWDLVDVDVVRVAPAVVEAQCIFGDGSSEYTLDLRLERGYELAQWLVPESVSAAVPSGLQDLLSPVANTQAYVSGAELGLVAREEVRK